MPIPVILLKGDRGNRRLVCQVLDEVLADFFVSYVDDSNWVKSSRGSEAGAPPDLDILLLLLSEELGVCSFEDLTMFPGKEGDQSSCCKLFGLALENFPEDDMEGVESLRLCWLLEVVEPFKDRLLDRLLLLLRRAAAPPLKST